MLFWFIVTKQCIFNKQMKLLSDDRHLYLHNSKSDVDGLTHTKQLLNLLCILTEKLYLKSVSFCNDNYLEYRVADLYFVPYFHFRFTAK